MKKYEQITIHVSPGFTEKLDKLSEKLNMSRSNLVRNLLESAYEDAVILEKVGALQAVQILKKLRNFKENLLNEITNKNKE